MKDHYSFPIKDPDLIEEAFELLSSAMEIAKREGDGTNWDGFQKSIQILFGKIRRNPVTARTYRKLPDSEGEV